MKRACYLFVPCVALPSRLRAASKALRVECARMPRCARSRRAVTLCAPSAPERPPPCDSHERTPSPQSHSQSHNNPPRMFSNVAPDAGGTLRRVEPSQLACTCLIAGTMIGAGVLALPTVSAPVGFVPSSLALIVVWTYMLATGLLISELTVNTACALGRPNGISILSLASLTLGPFGAFVATVSYTLLHYAILTAYTSQGASEAFTLVRYVCDAFHLSVSPLFSSPLVEGALFSTVIGAAMFVLSARNVQRVNNVLVAGVIAAFCAVLSASISDFDLSRLSQLHWDMLARGPLVAVLFVSCVYHNVVSNVTMRLEGDRTKIRRTIVIGTAIPLLMFLTYDAAILASNTGAQQLNQLAVALFSTLAIATSFIGFVEGLTELWADVRQTLFQNNKQTGASGTNAADFVATIGPPTVMAGLWPDAFLNALDAAGTYGIAVLFGALPAAMAWRNRRREGTKELGRSLVGGDVVLAALALPPLVLIAQRLYSLCSTWLAAHAS